MRNLAVPESSLRHGFALVISLSLMVLLTVLAIGLLTLSSVSLRSSVQSDAIATARANARMALVLAIGQLQKDAGPDQRVTARADILAENVANPRLTGVWDSWEMKATAPPRAEDFEKAAKDRKFRSWLVSGGDPGAVAEADFASKEAKNPVMLWDEGSLGKSAAAAAKVKAAKVPVGNSSGAFAWAAMDEGIKARINTPHNDEALSTADRTAQLGAGERPAAEFIPGLDGLEPGYFEDGSDQFTTLRKGMTALTYSLAGDTLSSGIREALQPLLHDVTTYSSGLFTDTARGGLRKDFDLLANSASLPSAFAAKGVYASRLGLSGADAISDPRWESLHQYGRLHRDKITITGGVPVLKAQAPAGWQAATIKTNATTQVATLNRNPPPGVVMMPSVAKVQMLFSLIARDLYSYPAFKPGSAPPAVPETASNMHGPQDNWFRGTKYDYDLHLLYTPVVTLHNPYNVALEFRNMKVEFLQVPFAMQVFRNGAAQSRGLIPLEKMYGDNQSGAKSKVFSLELKTKSNGKPGSTTFRLMPGEVKMFSPYIDPTRTYQQEVTNWSGRTFWDVETATSTTAKIAAIPGWPGDGVGFDCDWLAGDQPIDGVAANGRWESCLGLARNDLLHVEFAPLSSSGSDNKFVIRMSASTGTSSAVSTVNAIEMNYESPTGLQDTLLGKGKTLRFPSTGTVRAIDLLDHSTRPIKEIVNVKPFALLSVQAKATSGGRDPSGKDGRIATKPWCFGHASIGASSQKIVSEHSANHSHEIDLQPLELGEGTDKVLQLDDQDRGNFITGHTSDYGSKFGAQYDVPLAPVQTLAGLNGANPGGSSGYLPRFAQPLGNSWAHPLLAPDKIVQSGGGISYLDHSFLLNLALYDSFYFSGLAERIGPFGSGTSAATLATDFANGKPLADPRLSLHPPDGEPASLLAEAIADTDAFASVAAWQRMDGAFNINSTSVSAWKAMLASVQDSRSMLNLLNPAASNSSLSNLDPAGDRQVRMSRFRLPASKSAEDGADAELAYWLGPREFNDGQLQTLAENIVAQVRQRGPFLSLAEFVNRRPGSGATALRGALQQAIDDSDLNESLATAADAGYDIPASLVSGYKYGNPAAGSGPSYQGAPGFFTQADLLNVLGNAATARSDTFTIRGYGEALDPAGKITARAICEAVVQRASEWLDPGDAAGTAIAALQSKANKNFGRRFLIVSFRWLAPAEI